MNPSNDLNQFISDFTRYMSKLEARIDKIEAFLEPQMAEQERLNRLEEERHKELARMEEQKFKQEKLVCNLQRYSIFAPVDADDNTVKIPLEIEIIFSVYKSNIGLSGRYGYDPIKQKGMTIKTRGQLCHDEVILLHTQITVIKPNEECRQTWRGKHGDVKCEATIIAFPKGPTDHIGIMIKIDDASRTCSARIVDMNDSGSSVERSGDPPQWAIVFGA